MCCFNVRTHAGGCAQTMYKASKRRFDEDAEFKDRARKAVTQLQGGNPQFIEAWQRICAASRKVAYTTSSLHLLLLLFAHEPAPPEMPPPSFITPKSPSPHPCSCTSLVLLSQFLLHNYIPPSHHLWLLFTPAPAPTSCSPSPCTPNT